MNIIGLWKLIIIQLLFKMLHHLLAYQDQRVDGFYSDSTVLVLHGPYIEYYSETGTRATLKSSDIPPDTPVSQKLIQLLKKYNKYSQSSLYCMNMMEEQEEVVKSTKIGELSWGGKVEEVKSGYRLYSIDRTSFVEVNLDLMLVRVSYLQEIGDRCVVYKAKKERNITKDLLVKYNLEYQEYPEPQKVTTLAYKYIRESKIYVLNRIPEKWLYPVNRIWNHIQTLLNFNPVIEPFTLTKLNTTLIQPIQFIEESPEIKIENMGVSVFRFPRHSSLVDLVVSVEAGEERVGWISPGEAVCYDTQGYWILNYQSLHLKFSNSLDTEKIYNANALPLVVRAQNKYQKNIKDFLIAVYNASSHRPLQPLFSKPSLQSLPSINSQTTSESKQLHKIHNEYGMFTTLSNHIVTGRFNDGILVIANYLSQTAKIKDKDGNSITTNINDKFYSQYLRMVTECYQGVYYPEEYRRRNRLAEEMQQRIMFNESLVQYIGSGDYTKKTYSQSTKEDFGDIDQVIRRSEEVLKKLEKYK